MVESFRQAIHTFAFLIGWCDNLQRLAVSLKGPIVSL